MAPPTTIANTTASRALKSAEWMAENAYIAPGFHRLLTAGGLTLGLLGGRKLMDVITARSAVDDHEIPPAHTPEILRPLHGIMRYNTYSDAPTERWKFVVDRVTPVAIGAVSAYLGGKLFFHGKLPGREPFSAAASAAKTAWNEKKIALDVADLKTRVLHSDIVRKPAATTFIEGSATGQHLPGALWPFNNGLIAVSFQIGADRNILIPGFLPFARQINRWLGNYGSSSRGFYSAMRNTTKWIESNVCQFDRAEQWAHPEALLSRVRDGLQKFPNRTAADEQKLLAAYRKLIDDAYHLKATHSATGNEGLAQKIYDFVSGNKNPKRGLLGHAYEHMLHDSGIDLTKARLASGPWSDFARLFGSREKETAILKTYAEHLKTKFPAYAKLDVNAWVKEQQYIPPWKVAAAYTSGAAAIGGALWSGSIAVDHLHRESQKHHKPHIRSEESPILAPHYQSDSQPHTGSNIVDWVNGKPLDVAHWISRVLITPPSMHRFMNAAYLSLVLFGGMKFANILTGRQLTKLTSSKFITDNAGALIHESTLSKANVWAPFKPLHGLLAYTPGSAAIEDRWRQAAHYIIPVGLGMFGTYTGSHLYFKDRIKSLEAPKTLEDFADRISLEQSKVYAGATALTSIFNTGSGIHLLPVFNYSSNLHNRYLMGSGQQVALPGLGKWWSGNAGTTPWGVKRSLGYMINYLTYNPTTRPNEIPALVHSVIGKLYPNLSEPELLDKKQIMIDRIYDVRDSYLVGGTIPETKQAALKSAMTRMLSGHGFENLLLESGLNPAQANLANNGASGTIADSLGKRGDVRKLTEEYRRQFNAYTTAQPPKPGDFIRQLLDKGAANDSHFSHADRIKNNEASRLASRT